MVRRFGLVAVVLSSLVACSDAAEGDEATSQSTSEELVACGWLAGGDCARVPAGDWRSPELWADLYLAKYAAQRKRFNENVEPGPKPLDKPRTVVLVTGVTIRAEWFDGIAARLRRDGFKTVVYEPPHLLTGDLFQASKELGAFVERVQRDSGDEKVDILAECTGGLISRHYVQSLGGDRHVSRVVTFVSPQHGIGVVPIAARITGWRALYDLSPGSAFLRAVNGASMPASVPFTSIYTCDDEYIRPYRTANVPGATNVEICGGQFVGHFRTMYDPAIYMMMHDALVKEPAAR